MNQTPLFELEPSAASPDAAAAAARKVRREARQRAILLQAQDKLDEVMPTLEQDFDIHFATAGAWSAHHLLFWALDQIGPAHMLAATWSMNQTASDMFLAALTRGDLLSLRLLLDWNVRARRPGIFSLLKHNDVDLRIANCHAKVFVLRNSEWTVTASTSSNFTTNPRIEAGIISTAPEIARFHAAWIEAELERQEPFGIDTLKLTPTEEA